jgi:hypothetical protein
MDEPMLLDAFGVASNMGWRFEFRTTTLPGASGSTDAHNVALLK